MKLIFEAGASKTSIAYIDNQHIAYMEEIDGINPYHDSKDLISASLQGTFQALTDMNKVTTEIYFFGAGCKGEKQISRIEEAFANFTEVPVKVKSDIYASCLATCQEEPGLVGILGTGSKIALYDGSKIIKEDFSRGYLFGDAGSGYDLGHAFLNLYFKDHLIEQITEAFHNFLNFKNKEQTLEKVYKHPKPKKFIASLSMFIHQHRNLALIQKLIGRCFDNFFAEFEHWEHQTKIIHFTGGIAYNFKEELEKVTIKNGFTLGKVINKPSESLLQYFLNK